MRVYTGYKFREMYLSFSVHGTSRLCDVEVLKATDESAELAFIRQGLPEVLVVDMSCILGVRFPADVACSMTINKMKTRVHMSADEAYFARSRGLAVEDTEDTEDTEVTEDTEEDSHVEE